MARLWLSFYQVTNKQDYYIAAEQAITFVTRTQNVRTSNPNIRGGIAGSYPIYGCYERFKYPNWATKFFVDALLTLESVKKQNNLMVYVG